MEERFENVCDWPGEQPTHPIGANCTWIFSLFSRRKSWIYFEFGWALKYHFSVWEDPSIMVPLERNVAWEAFGEYHRPTNRMDWLRSENKCELFTSFEIFTFIQFSDKSYCRHDAPKQIHKPPQTKPRVYIERTVDKSIERLEFSICFEAAWRGQFPEERRIGKVVPPHIISPVRPLLSRLKEKEKEIHSSSKKDFKKWICKSCKV